MIFLNKHTISALRLGVLCLGLGACFASCEKYVDVDKAPNMLENSSVFLADGTATGAVVGIYSYYNTTGALQYFTFAGELESGEMEYQLAASTPEMNEFQQSAVLPTSITLNTNLWMYPYMSVRAANLALEGLTASTTLTPALRTQLLGEARFLRAFFYFHLVNYFGPVPLVLSSDQNATATLPRASVDSVYNQIIADLKEAESLLPAVYTGTFRTRVNKYAAAALLARAYLYKGDNVNAEAAASRVIGATDVTYNLPDLSTAFVNSSNEVILQIGTLYGSSLFGTNYRTTAASGIPNYYLTNAAVSVFETGDNRRALWVDSVVNNSTLYRRINKYKVATATAASGGNEYNIMLRLAEQYLIRAEARAKQDNIGGAQSDLNAVRGRAGLGNTPAATQDDLVKAVLKERQTELFGETGHRWFDLKRSGNANTVLSVLKPATWKATAVLLPIPYTELLKNTNLKQNDGYNP